MLGPSSPPCMNLLADSVILRTPAFPLELLGELDPYILLEGFVTGGVGSGEGSDVAWDTGDLEASELAGDMDLTALEFEGLWGRTIHPNGS